VPRVRAIVPTHYRTAITVTDEPDDDQPLDNLWEGVLVVEGLPTGDGRMMERGALRWENLPLPLRWARADVGAHDGAVTVGRILEIWRDGDRVMGRGDLDLGSPEGREVARLMTPDEHGARAGGVSVDLDDIDIEIRVAAEMLDEAMLAPENADTSEREREVDEDGRVTVFEFAMDDELMVTTDARVRAATIVDVPAFIDARLHLTGRSEDTVAASVVASSAPPAPPAAWFTDPQFGEAGRDPRLVEDGHGNYGAPITVTRDGRLFGHIALWRTCHTGFPGECVNPPVSGSGYRYFHVGAVVVDDGREIPVGRITIDTLHAGRRLSAVDTLAHYENTGLAVADVRAGEDAYGIWIAGSLRPGVTDEQVRALRASPLSGDWRRVGGSLELVAALAVNSPGFPVPRALVASGDVVTLQTAGLAPSESQTLTEDEMAVLRRMAARETQAAAERRDEVERSRRRVLVASAASRVRGGR
jgi:hypothetical protein